MLWGRQERRGGRNVAAPGVSGEPGLIRGGTGMKVRLAMLSVLAGLMCIAAFWVAPVAFAEKLPVTICHRTGSDDHPYHAITPSNAGVVSAHVGDPEGTGHVTKGLHDFLLDFGNGTDEDCAKADPGK